MNDAGISTFFMPCTGETFHRDKSFSFDHDLARNLARIDS